MMNNHSIEPELLRPTPRPVRARSGKGSGVVGCVRVFILPHLLVGIFAFLSALSMTLVTLFGASIPATITGHYTTPDSDGDDTHRVRYSYSLGDRQYNDEAKVSQAEYAYPDGTVAPLKIFPLLPFMGKQLLLPGAKSYRRIGFLWFFALFWNGLLSIFVWVAYVIPVVQRKLVSRGAACVGRVIYRTVSTSEDSESYTVYYEYAPLDMTESAAYLKALAASQKKNPSVPAQASPGMLAGQTGVTQSEYESVRQGDAVTVLYNPAKPLQSEIYRFCDYEIVS